MKLNKFWEGVSTGIAWLLMLMLMLILVPLSLAATGFFFKLLWACLLLGWNIL